jgi:hypothetical protein
MMYSFSQINAYNNEVFASSPKLSTQRLPMMRPGAREVDGFEDHPGVESHLEGEQVNDMFFNFESCQQVYSCFSPRTWMHPLNKT